MVEKNEPVVEEVSAADMIKSAKAAAKEKIEVDPLTKFSTKRTRGAGQRDIVHDEAVPWPLEHLDPDGLSPSAYAAVIDDVGTSITERVFHLDISKLKGLPFMPPGQAIPGKKPLYTVKAIHKDGRLVQIPFEDQINNTAGGDRADAIGLRRMQRKGILLLMDWETFRTVYCPAGECWAKANDLYENFCCPQHRDVTLPGRGIDSDIRAGLSSNSTTSRTWKM